MTYPDTVKIKKLNESLKDEFLAKLNYLNETSTDKNRDWFPPLLKDWNTKYLSWYLAYDGDDNLFAFSAIQKFPNEWFRVLTRYWHNTRKSGLTRGVILNEMTPAMLILKEQLLEIGDSKIFMSMEYINRRRHMEALSKKINNLYNMNFQLNAGFQLTCNNRESFSCWQNTISNAPIDLPTISTEDYILKFKNIRKTTKKD